MCLDPASMYLYVRCSYQHMYAVTVATHGMNKGLWKYDDDQYFMEGVILYQDVIW